MFFKSARMPFIFISLFFHYSVCANWQVISSSGYGFYKKGENHPVQEISVGDELGDFFTLFLEEKSQMTLINHESKSEMTLTGGSHIKVERNFLTLSSEGLWFNGKSKSLPYFINTPNSVSKVTDASVVVLFDGQKLETQSLCLKGEVSLKALTNMDLDTTLTKGTFSTILTGDNSVTPRKPTLIGADSYFSIQQFFHDQKDLGKHIRFAKNSSPKGEKLDSVASLKNDLRSEFLSSQDQASLKTNKVTFTSKSRGRLIDLTDDVSRKPSSFSFHVDAAEYIQKTYHPHKRRPKLKTVKIEFVELAEQNTQQSLVEKQAEQSEKELRRPASIRPISSYQETVKKNTTFENSLDNISKSHPKHSQELLKLMKELDSVDKDFTDSY